MRRILTLIMAAWLVLGATLAGCGPDLSDEDLGQVETKASDLPGAGEEYKLPEAEVPPEGGNMDTSSP